MKRILLWVLVALVVLVVLSLEAEAALVAR